MSIIERTQAALQGDQRAADLDELHVELRMHVKTTSDRLKAITAKDTSTFANAPGPERQAAIDAGDLDAIKAMGEEAWDLTAEIEVLRSLQKRLRKQLDATRANDFVEQAPARYSELGKLLAAENKAQAALQAARLATEAALRDLTAQRQHVVTRGTTSLKFPPASDVLLRQLMHARDYTYSRGPSRIGYFSPTGGPAQLTIMASALGLPVPHPAAMAAA